MFAINSDGSTKPRPLTPQMSLQDDASERGGAVRTTIMITQEIIQISANLALSMPRNPLVIKLNEALKTALAAKPVEPTRAAPITAVDTTECATCQKRRATKAGSMRKYRSKPKLK